MTTAGPRVLGPVEREGWRIDQPSAEVPYTDIRPIDDLILLDWPEAKERTTGGVLVPRSVRDAQANGSLRPRRATILAVGPGRLNDAGVTAPMDLRVGQTVIFGTAMEPMLHECPGGARLYFLPRRGVLATVSPLVTT